MRGPNTAVRFVADRFNAVFIFSLKGIVAFNGLFFLNVPFSA